MLPVWLLAELNDYDILLEVLGTLGRIYVSRPVAKTLVLDWKSWLAQLFLDVFVTLCGVKKLLVDVANLATCWTNDYDILLEVLGTLGRIYVSRPVAKTLVLDWKSWLAQLFLDVFVTLCGVNEPLLDPKKLQNQEFYIIDWIRKKLLVDVANLATCWTNDYDILLEVLGTLGRIYVSRPVAKTLVLDWKSWLAQLFLDVFVTLCGVNPCWTQKSFKIKNFIWEIE